MSREDLEIRVEVGELTNEPGEPMGIMDFSEEVSWFAYTGKQAVLLALRLLEAALEIPKSGVLKVDKDETKEGGRYTHKGSTRIH